MNQGRTVRERSYKCTLLFLFLASAMWSLSFMTFTRKLFVDFKKEELFNAAVVPCKTDEKKEVVVEADGYLEKLQMDSHVHGNRTVNFLSYNRGDMKDHDRYSAMWWWKTNEFYRFNVSILESIEAASFDVFNMVNDVRMTRDWLDFSVEHPSKYWKSMDGEVDMLVMKRLLDVMQDYFDRLEPFFEDEPVNPITQQTIAVVPINSGHPLKTFALAATLAGMWQIGIGRAIVFGDNENEKEDIMAAFKVMEVKMAKYKNHPPMELSFSYGRESSSFKERHTPKAALHCLQDALLGKYEKGSGEEKIWLGNNPDIRRWKYVYFTEPDLLLVTRPSALPALTAEVQKPGIVLSAHRLQPVPHELDLPNYQYQNARFLPNKWEFANVSYLDQYGEDSCCDAGIGNPGRDNHPFCGKIWTFCGFSDGQMDVDNATLVREKHKRLLDYPLVSLTRGSGLIFAGTNHARRCIPQHNTIGC